MLKFGVRKAVTFLKVSECRGAGMKGACGAGGEIIAKNGFWILFKNSNVFAFY